LLTSFINVGDVVVLFQRGEDVGYYGACVSREGGISVHKAPMAARNCIGDVKCWGRTPNQQERNSPGKGEGSRRRRGEGGKEGGGNCSGVRDVC